MRLLLGIIVTLFVSVWMALALRQDPGYVMLSSGQWTVETSLTFFTKTQGYLGLAEAAVSKTSHAADVYVTLKQHP